MRDAPAATLALSCRHRPALLAAIVTFPRVLFFVVVLVAGARLRAVEIGVGDSRETVLQQTGEPTSRAQRGNREILLFPHGGRVELIDGKVVDVRGPLPAKPAPVAQTPAKMADASAGSASAPVPVTTPTPAPATAARAVPVPGFDATTAGAAANTLGQSIEKMDTAWGERPKIPVAEPKIQWPKLLVSLVLHFAITLFALKLAFKIEEMDALWSGTLAIAGIDAAVYFGLELLGPVTAGLASGMTLEGAVGAIVMVFTIQKFCFTKKIQYAVVTAMSVKLIVQLCHMFLFVLLLNALFG